MTIPFHRLVLSTIVAFAVGCVAMFLVGYLVFQLEFLTKILDLWTILIPAVVFVATTIGTAHLLINKQRPVVTEESRKLDEFDSTRSKAKRKSRKVSDTKLLDKVSEVSDSELLYKVREYLRAKNPDKKKNYILLVVSMVAFIFFGKDSLKTLVIVAGVLLFHEGGHWALMRIFGYRDVNVFFIPFFGGATTGRKENAPVWQEALVLLAGPIPGMIVACVLLAVFPHSKGSTMYEVIETLLVINWINLIPIAPLDGGKFFSLLLFSRRSWLEIAFAFVSGVAMIGLGISLQIYFLAVIGGFSLFSLSTRWKYCQAAKRIQVSGKKLGAPLAKIDESLLSLLMTESQGLSAIPRTDQVKYIVDSIQEIYRRACLRHSAMAATLALLLVYGVGLVIGVAGVGILHQIT
jgi:Zn-dependent protease